MALSLSAKAFELQLKWLKENNYIGLRQDELPEAIQRPDFGGHRYIVISFDDGYSDNIDVALPLLDAYGFKATFFVVAGMVKNEQRMATRTGHMLYPHRLMMNCGDLRQLCKDGMEVGSHGWSHQQATRINGGSIQDFSEELIRSKNLLEDITGSPVHSFSYPNGQRGAFSDETRKQIMRNGYLTASTTIWGALSGKIDIYSLPRCAIYATDSIRDFDDKMTGRREYRRIIAKISKRSKIWYNNPSSKLDHI
jgi:peptidoglycan/xylan/chitin deacetylase (PgdA/CDA1 family)